MKGAKFLLGVTLSLGTLGAAVGGAVFANNTNKSAEPAYAVTTKKAGSRIWVNTNGSTGGWAKDNAKLSAWVWYESGSAWADVNWDSTANYYYFDLASSATGLTFVRGSQYKNWDAKWNQADVNFSSASYNLLNATSTGGSIPASPWSEYKVQNSGATLYVNTGGQTTGWAADNAKISAWCWKTDGSEWANATWDSSSGFYKFTLPGNSSGFTLLRDEKYRTGTTWGTGDGWNKTDIHLDSKKTLLNGANAVPGTLNWGFYCDTYIYYVNDDSNPTGNYVYSWGSSNYFGSWPGTLITSIGGVTTVEGDVKFNGSVSKKIYKIPYSTFAGDTGVKFRGGGDDWQTADFTLGSGYAYNWTTDVPAAGTNAAMGLAIDLILQEESLRKAATNQSVCNISASACYSLYDSYSKSGAAKSYIDSSKTLTYPSVSTSDPKVDVSLQDVFHQIGLRGGNISESAVINRIINNRDNSILIIIAVASLIAFAAGGYFYFRKRKVTE